MTTPQSNPTTLKNTTDQPDTTTDNSTGQSRETAGQPIPRRQVRSEPTPVRLMTEQPTSTQLLPAEAEILVARLTSGLRRVGVLTVVFTMVNVTLFAISRGVPWPIALLLDPMVALALATVLYADARLASWGMRPPGWSTMLRWFAGLAATLMNTWSSLWPDGRPGWPRDADPAAVFLHAVPPVLLILLTETVAAYRRHLTPHTPPPVHNRPAPRTPRTGTNPDHNRPDAEHVPDWSPGPAPRTRR